jgi:hypothetical protein
MVSPKVNLLINIASFLDFAVCALTGFFMRENISKLNLREIHVFSGKILLFLIVVHLIVHYKWIKNIPSFLRKK